MIRARQLCEQCHAKVSAKARWCPSCGAELPEKVVAVEPDATIAPAVPLAVQRRSPLLRFVTPALVALIVLALAASVLVFFDKRDSTVSHHQQTSAGVRADLLQRAAAMTSQAFTYNGATIDKDLAASATLMTPEMGKKFLDQLTPDARKNITSRGESIKGVVSADSMVSMTEDSARVLVLLVVTTTVKGGKGELQEAHRIRVSLSKLSNQWLISDMENF